MKRAKALKMDAHIKRDKTISMMRGSNTCNEVAPHTFSGTYLEISSGTLTVSTS
jgi:hypothetical protein